jgi:FimV-like protein
MVVAQTQDFHAYRQRLAQGSRAKAPAEANAAHETTGAVQSAKVNDQHAKEQSPDRLTVSKASAKDSTTTQIAQSREESAQTDRVAELTKNIQELSRLESEAKTETKIASADKAATPETAASPNGKLAAGTPPSNETASTASAPAAAHGSDTTVASAASAAPAATPQAAQKSAAIQVKADPPPAPAGQPAWYDGLTENPSTLGLGGALIVLLAGLGLYSARRRKAKEAAAFADIGDDFDDDAGAHSSAGSAVADKPREHAASGAAAVEKAVAGAAAAGAVALNADSKETKDEPAPSALDLALDVGDENGAAAAAPAPADEPVMADFQPTALAPHMPVLESDPIGGTNTAEKPTAPSPTSDFPATEVQFTPPSAPPSATPSQKESADDDKGMIDFDVDALPLPHGEPEWKADDAGVPPQNADDPLTTKLSLAQEFSNIGDNEGARSLAQEVVASATGELKKRAENFLASL